MDIDRQSHCRGREFDSHYLHQINPNLYVCRSGKSGCIGTLVDVAWNAAGFWKNYHALRVTLSAHS